MAQQLPEEKRGAIYNNLKAAAESGWDFSFRWCIADNEKSANLSLVNVSTSDIIPVELNAILERNARMLAGFHKTLGNWKVTRDTVVARCKIIPFINERGNSLSVYF